MRLHAAVILLLMLPAQPHTVATIELQSEAAEVTFEHIRDPKALAAEILARPEFHGTPASRWLDEQRERVAKWILGVVSRLAGRSVQSRALAVMFVWITSGLALVVLSIWLARTLARRSHRAALDLGSGAFKRTAAREWALRAIAAARGGDLREAVRCGYHAALCRLEEQGLWNLDESRTPREYMQLLARDDPRYATLSDLTRQFEQVCYGRRTATGDDVRQVAVHMEQLGCVRAAERAI